MSGARADRLLGSLAERDLDAVIVTDLTNLRWLTGFTGTNGACLLSDDERLLLTDFRYLEQAARQAEGFEVVRASEALLMELGARLPAGRVGFDDASLSVRGHARLEEKIAAGVELVPAGGVVEALRQVKDAREIERIAAATALATAALERTLERGLVGRSERALALDLEQEMRLAGAQEPSFPSIVAHGAHGALPHAEARDVPIAAGTLVTIDWGARLDGYCSDCTRTFAAGKVGEREREVYELVLAAERAGLTAVEPGAVGSAVDGVARTMIAEAGYGDHFGHGLGHGVGLEVHEGPRLTKVSDDVLGVGMVVTVEPGVYLPGELGVRIEDLVVVEENAPRILTSLPTELITI